MFSDEEVHWRFREDMDDLVNDPEDAEILAGMSEVFTDLAQTPGPGEVASWLSTSYNLAMQLDGPHVFGLCASVEGAVDALFHEHIGPLFESHT